MTQIEKPMLMTRENYFKCDDGRKTQTRRVTTPQPKLVKDEVYGDNWQFPVQGGHACWTDGTTPQLCGKEYMLRKCPHPVGSKIWIKEPFRVTGINVCKIPMRGITVVYSHDNKKCDIVLTEEEHKKLLKWKKPFQGKSGMFMFKSLARLWLEVTAVKVERLQDISEEDIVAEGIVKPNYEGLDSYDSDLVRLSVKQSWIDLWDSINGKKYPWKSNPWAWAYTFKRIKQ